MKPVQRWNMLDPKSWTKETLQQYSADMRQFVGARDITLNGMRALHLYNAAGLEFIVLPDRGFDIWDARYKGIPLTWLAPGSPFPPDWGADWLRQFNGGLLTTCGLTHVGPPEIDDVTGEKLGLHGNCTRLRAGNYQVSGEWNYSQPEDEINYYEVRYSATIEDKSLFGAQLMLERTYFFSIQEPLIGIADDITNEGDTPTPLMLLYHFNLGFPVIRDGVKLFAPGTVYPRDNAARIGLETWDSYGAPEAQYAEQVYFHHLREQRFRPVSNEDLATEPHDVYRPEDADSTSRIESAGFAQVMIGDEDFALHLRWDTESLPYFTQWKNLRQHQYVNGIEPGNCIPEGRNSARKSGRLKTLQPGEHISTYLCLTVLDNPDSIRTHREFMDELPTSGTLMRDCKLDDFAPHKE